MSGRRRWAVVGGFGLTAAVALASGLLGPVGWLATVGWYGLAAAGLHAVAFDVF